MLEQVRDGAMGIDDAIGRMRHMPFEDLGFAKVDHHRALRHGMPEVIFGKGKAPEHVLAIGLDFRIAPRIGADVEILVDSELREHATPLRHHHQPPARARQPGGDGRGAGGIGGGADRGDRSVHG